MQKHKRELKKVMSEVLDTSKSESRRTRRSSKSSMKMNGLSTALVVVSTERTLMMESTALRVSDVMYGNIASAWDSPNLLLREMISTSSARTVERGKRKPTDRRYH